MSNRPCPTHEPHYNVDCPACAAALASRLDASGRISVPLTPKVPMTATPSPTPRRRLLSEVISSESLASMRAAGGTWAAYECHALDSSLVGALRFLRYGKGCTYATPPERWPGGGSVEWSFVLVGYVDLPQGAVMPRERAVSAELPKDEETYESLQAGDMWGVPDTEGEGS